MWIDGTGLPTEKHTPSPRQGRPVLASPPMAPMSRPTASAPPPGASPWTDPPTPSGATSRPRIARRPPWPRRPCASTTGTARTSWPWRRRPATPPRPGAAWRPTRPGPTAAGPAPAAPSPGPRTGGRSGPSIPRRPPATRRSWRRSCGWGSIAGSATPRCSWLLPSPSTVAARLGGGRLAAHLREWPGLVGDALRALAETQIRFAELCLAEGLAGVLYAVHVARRARARRVHLRRDARAPRPRGAGRRSTAGPRCAWSTSPGRCPSRGWRPGPPTSSAGRRAPTCRRSPTGTRGSGRAALGGLDARGAP